MPDTLSDALITIAEKDQLISTLRQQIDESADERARLEWRAMGREEKIEVLESKVEMYAGNYLEATRKQSDLESQVKELQQKLDSVQEAKVQAQRLRDEEMAQLFNDVVLDLGWPQNFNPERPDDEVTCLISSDHFSLGERPRLLQLNNTAA